MDAREGLKRGGSYWVFETGVDAGDASRKGRRAENCVNLGTHARAGENRAVWCRACASCSLRHTQAGWVDDTKGTAGSSQQTRCSATFEGGKIGCYS